MLPREVAPAELEEAGEAQLSTERLQLGPAEVRVALHGVRCEARANDVLMGYLGLFASEH